MARLAVFHTQRAPLRVKDSKLQLALQDARAAAYAADGYSRATGRLAIVVTFDRIEALEAASAVPVSWGDHIPLIVVNIAEECDLELLRTTYRPVRRGVVEVKVGDDIPSKVRELARLVAAGTPVQMIAPSDIETEPLIDAIADLEIPTEPEKDPDPAEVEAVAEALAPLKRPVILLGREAVLDEDLAFYADLAEKLHCPVLLTASAATLSAWRSFDWPSEEPLIPNPNPAWLLTLWRADGVLALGTSLSEADLFGLHDMKLFRGRVLCCVGREDRDARRPCRPCVRHGPASFVTALLKQGTSPKPEGARDRWLRRTRRTLAKLAKMTTNEGRKAEKKVPLDPAYVAYQIEQRSRSELVGAPFPEATIFLAEGNGAGMWVRSFRGLNPIVYPVKMASIGVSLPWSAGVHLGRPLSRVFAVVGDGSFLFQAPVLRDLKRLEQPVVFFVLNDASWNSIRMEQTFVFRNRYIGTALPDIDYKKVAELHGCVGERVEDSEQLNRAITKAMLWHEEKSPLVIDVKVAPDGVPFAGLCFVLAELDYILWPMRWKVLASLLVSGIRGKIPPRIVVMLVRLLFT
jgi:acetolactate synthase-1/2/3 large subunit